MKYYGIKRKNIKNYASLEIYKLFKKIDYLTELDKKKRTRKKEDFYYTFIRDSPIKKSNQIDEDFFYEQHSIVATDLVAKENIQELKKSLETFQFKFSTKKFLGNFSNVDALENTINNLNNDVTDSNSWINIGRFDFSSNFTLNQNIDYFDIKIMNFSSSFFAIQFKIFMSDERKKNLAKLINENYKGNNKKLSSYYKQKKNKSGSHKAYTVTSFDEDDIKRKKINEFIIEIKWILFNEINKYLSTHFHSVGVPPPSLNIFKTNIDITSAKRSSFLRSIGYSLEDSLLVEDSTRLVLDDHQSLRNNNIFNDYTYVVNTENRKDDTSISLDTMINFESEHIYSMLIRSHILKSLKPEMSFLNSFYRNKINNMRIKKNTYKKFLALRYEYEKHTNIYDRLFEEIDWKYEKNKFNDFILNNKIELNSSHNMIIYRLIEYPFSIKEQFKKHQDYIKSNIANKLKLTGYLNDYKNQGRDFRINVITLTITITTFLSLLFPSIPIRLRTNIKYLIEYIIQLFGEL